MNLLEVTSHHTITIILRLLGVVLDGAGSLVDQIVGLLGGIIGELVRVIRLSTSNVADRLNGITRHGPSLLNNASTARSALSTMRRLNILIRAVQHISHETPRLVNQITQRLFSLSRALFTFFSSGICDSLSLTSSVICGGAGLGRSLGTLLLGYTG
jgi:hypothetical protein